MSQKTFPISFNAIPFRSAKMRTKLECNVTERRHRPFAYRSFSFCFLPLGYEEKPLEAFLESGRSPARAMASPSDNIRSIVKARA